MLSRIRFRNPGIEPSMTPEDAKTLLQKIANKEVKTCAHCLGLHARACPRVKRMVFVGEEIKEIEFWRDDEYSDSNTLWLDDLQEIADNAEQDN